MPKRTPSLCYHKPSHRYYIRLNRRPVYVGYDKAAARIEADRLLGEWLANGRRPRVAAGTFDLSIAELVDRYREFATGYYRKTDGSPSGHLSVVKSALRTLRKLYGETAAAEFGPLGLRALRDRMIHDGLSRSYINGQLHRIRLAFKWAVGRELIPVETYQRLATVEGLRKGRSEAREPEPIRPVDDATIEATLPFLSPTLADVVKVQALTGMRPGEVLLMRPRDIDRVSDVWIYTPASHKTAHHGHRRHVPIGPRCQVILSKYLLRASDAYLFSPAEVVEKQRQERHSRRKIPHFSGNRPGTNRKRNPRRKAGEFYARMSYYRAITRAAEMADKKEHSDRPDVPGDVRLVPHWHPNQLRHGRATELRKLYGIEAVAATLGHARLQTSEIYAERNLDLAMRVAREVG